MQTANKRIVPVLEQVLYLLKRECQMSTNCYQHLLTTEYVNVCVGGWVCVSYLLNQREEVPQPSATLWPLLQVSEHKVHQHSSGYSPA